MGRCGGGVARDAVLLEGISPVGWAFGLFCVRGGVSKGSLSPSGGRRGLRRSRATQYRSENRHWLALRCASDYDDPHRVARLGREDALGQETTHWDRKPPEEAYTHRTLHFL